MFSQTQTSVVEQHDCGEISVIPALTCSNYSCVEASFSYEIHFLWTFWTIKWEWLAFTLILNTSFLSPYLHRFRKFSKLKPGEVIIAVHSGFNSFIWNLVNSFQIMHVKCHASKVKRNCTRLTKILGQELLEMVLFKSVLTVATVSSGSNLHWLQYRWDYFTSHGWLWHFRYLLMSWHLLNSFSGHTGLGES